MIEEFPEDPCPSMSNMQVPTEISYLSPHTNSDPRKDAFPRTMYGYESQESRNNPDNPNSGYVVGCVTNAKLLLDKSKHIQPLKKQLKEQLEGLAAKKVITKPEDVIRDLLVCFLQHTKTFLQKYHYLKYESVVEVTFCVPVCWGPSANAIMSACLQGALKKVELCARRRGAYNLFMVNEAEAAAMYTLTSNFQTYRVTIPNYSAEYDHILITSSGARYSWYWIAEGVRRTLVSMLLAMISRFAWANRLPLLLVRTCKRIFLTILTRKGAICGSGDLNRAFYDFAMEHLQDAKDTFAGQATIADLINMDLMPQFESKEKRAFSLHHKHDRSKPYSFRLRGLKAIDGNSRIKKDAFVMS